MKMNIFKKLPQAMVRVIATGALLVATALGSVAIGVSDAGAAVPTTAVSFTPASLVANATSTWTVAATAPTGGIPASTGTITIAMPTAFTWSATSVVTFATGFTGTCAATTAGSTSTSIVVTLPSGCSVTTVHAYTITVAGVVNPGAALYAAAGFTVLTNVTGDAVLATGSDIVLTGQLTTPTVSAQPQLGSAKIQFLSDNTGVSFRVSNVDYTTPANGGTQTCDVVLSGPANLGTQNCTLTGLTPGDQYYFYVTPTNDGVGGVNTTSYHSTLTTISTALGNLGSLYALRAGTSVPTTYVAPANPANSTMMWITWVADGVASTYTVTNVDGTTAGNGHLSKQNCTISAAGVAAGTRVGCMATNLTADDTYTFTVSPNPSDTATSSSTVVGTPEVPAGDGTGIEGFVKSLGGGNARVYVPTDGNATSYVVNAPSGPDTCTITQATPSVGLASCDLTGASLSGTNIGSDFTITVSGGYTYSSAVAGTVQNTAVTSYYLTAPTVVAGPITGNYASAVVTIPASGVDGVASTYTVTVTTVATGATTTGCIVANTASAPVGAQTCTVYALAQGTAYTFSYHLSGNLDAGDSYPSNQITTLGGYTMLTVFSDAAGAGTKTAVFSADGKATTFTVKAYAYSTTTGTSASTSSATCVQTYVTAPLAGTTVSCTVLPLTSGSYYTFTVTASGGTETAGESTQSAPQVVTGTALTTPTVAKAAPNKYGANATVSFVADGVAAIYTVTWGTSLTASSDVFAGCIVANTVAALTGPQSCTVKSGSVNAMTAGSSYYFVVTPSGNLDSTTAQISAAYLARADLGLPTITGTGSKSVSASWTADGVSTGYEVDYALSAAGVLSSPTAGCVVSGTAALTGTQSCSITGLTNGVQYWFGVKALTGYSTQTQAAAPYTVGAITLTAPTISWSPKSTTSSGAATVSFVADGIGSLYTIIVYAVTPDSAIGQYVTCTTGNSTTPLTGKQSCDVTGLILGQGYLATVSAAGNGDSAATSPLSGPVPFIASAFSAPGAPGVTATALTATTVSVAFTAPVITGGSVIAGYLISGTSTDGTSSLVCGAGAAAAGTVVCTGAKPGTTYKVTVYAGGPFGISAAGTASVTTPAATLAAPTGASFVKGTATLTAAAKSALTSLASSIHDGASITVRGWGATKALAQARANAVASFLLTAGAAVHTTIIGIVSKASDAKVYQTA